MNTLTLTKIGVKHQITIPKKVFDALHLKIGDYISIETEPEGKAARITPSQVIPKDQAWFWTPEWQKMEREADEDIKAGRVSGPFTSAKELIKHLKSEN